MSTAAVRSPRAWAVLLSVLVLGLVADLATKYAAFAMVAEQPVAVERDAVIAADNINRLIPRHEPVVVVPSVLEFTLVLNPGAVFGIGAGKRWLFVAFTIVSIGLGLWMFARWTRARDLVAHASLGLLLSGGLGNLYDRLRYACVRDFIHPLPGVRIGSWEVWPYVSNVADAFLIIGIVGLMWHLWMTPTDDVHEQQGDSPEPAADQTGRD
ncbi:MAG: signal peptidase II [Planctomycetota bacterium]